MSLMMEAVRTSETSVDNHFRRQYNPEDNSEHHTRRRENLKSRKKGTDNSVFLVPRTRKNCNIRNEKTAASATYKREYDNGTWFYQV
jgi:hypothetical protein